MDALVRLSQFRVAKLTSMFRTEIDQYRQFQLHTRLLAVVSLQFRLHRAQEVEEETLAAPTVLHAPNVEIVDFWDRHSLHVKQTVAYGVPRRNQVTRGVFTKLHHRLNRQLRDLPLAMSRTAVRYVKT